MTFWVAAIYLICLLTSVTCAVLLFRSWRLTGSRILLWTAIGFCFFALKSLSLTADLVALPYFSFWPLRIAALLGVGTLAFGLVWEANR